MAKRKKVNPKRKEVKTELDLKQPWCGSQSLHPRLRIPCDVVMLCKLMNLSADNLLSGFLSCLAVESFDKNPEAAKKDCIDFFIHYGFGKDYYSEEDIRTMFTELAKVNDLFPREEASIEFIDVHSHWREKYYEYWFNKWYWKIRKKDI